MNIKIESSLLENDSIKQLVEYCESLEDKIFTYEHKSTNEEKLKQLVSEILFGIKTTLNQQQEHTRWPTEFPSINFEEAVINLNKYIKNYIETEKVKVGNY